VFVGMAAGRALGLFGQTLIIRALSPDVFGKIALAYVIVTGVGSVVKLGLRDGITRFYSAATTEAETNDVLRSGLLLAVVAGVVGAVIVYGLRFQFAELMAEEALLVFIPPLLVHICLYPSSEVLIGALRATGDSKGAVVAQHLIPKAGAIVVFVAAIALTTSVTAALAYWIVTPAITVLAAGIYVSGKISVTRVLGQLPERRTITELLSYSWPLAIGSVIFIFLSQLDVLMLGALTESTEVGLYRSVQPLQMISTFVMIAFSFLFLPIATEFYENDSLADLQEFYTVSTKWISALTLPLALTFAFFPESVVVAFFGQEYTGAAPVLTILIAGSFIRAIVGLNGDMVKAVNEPRVEMFAAVPGLVVNAVLNFLLIPRYGIVGAGVATVCGYAVYNLIELGFLYRHVGMHPFSGKLFRQLVPTIAFAFGCQALLGRLGLVSLVALGMVFSVVQLASTVLTRSVDRTDIMLLDRLEGATGVTFTRSRRILESYSR